MRPIEPSFAIAKPESEAEWRATRGCGGVRRRRAAVRSHRVDVEPVGRLLGHDQPPAIGAERDLGGTNSTSGERASRTRNRGQRATAADSDAADVAVAAGVQ